MSTRQFSLTPWVLAVLLVLLQCRLWFQHGGIIDMMRLKGQLTKEAQQNEQLQKRNADLLQQVQHLQKSDAAVESRARHELGMIKKGETFYQVVK